MAIRYVKDTDDRIRCGTCRQIGPSGPCRAAASGEIVASRSYEPDRTLLRRCEGYQPGPDDNDKRTGRQRWPHLLPLKERRK